MLRQKCSYGKDIEARKKPKSKEKIGPNFVKTKSAVENADIWWLH